MTRLQATWTHTEQIGWKGDPINGYPEIRQIVLHGEIVGFVVTHESLVCAVILTGSELMSVRIDELTTVEVV